MLVDAQARDLLLRCAEAGLVEIRWSEPVLEETIRALTDRLGVEAASAQRMANAMRTAFPEAAVRAFEHLTDRLDLPDPDDRHVLAAAVAGECDLLVTQNGADFPDATLARWDLLAIDVDGALLEIADINLIELGKVVIGQVAALKRPGTDLESFLLRLERTARRSAVLIGAQLGIETYRDLARDGTDVGSPDGPHAAVVSLLDVLAGDLDEVLDSLVDPACAGEITGRRSPTTKQLGRALRRELRNVLDDRDGWGFGSAKRLQAPGVELVKLVHLEPGLGIVREPRMVWAHLFRLEHRAAGWVLLRLNEPDPALQERS